MLDYMFITKGHRAMTAIRCVPCGTHLGARMTYAQKAADVKAPQLRRPKSLQLAVAHFEKLDLIEPDKTSPIPTWQEALDRTEAQTIRICLQNRLAEVDP